MVSQRPTSLPPSAVVLVDLRREAGWPAIRLADAAGLERKTISRYEKGKVACRPERLVELAGLMGFGRAEVSARLEAAERLSRGTVEPAHPLAPGREEQRAMAAKAAALLAGFEPLVYRALCREWREERIAADREQAAGLVAALDAAPEEERRRRVEEDPAYRVWALVPELGERSVRAAGRSVPEAVGWAALARLAAEAVDVPPEWRPRLRASALFFSANAERVANQLGEADMDVARAWSAWRQGEAEGLPLGEWRYLDLEASLRCDQGLLDEAVVLLKRALPIAPPEALARLCLSLGSFLIELGEPGQALEPLQAALPAIEESGDLRLRWVLSFHLAASLAELGRASEAEAFAEAARRLAREGGGRLDALRSDWVAARVDLALGRHGAARLAFAEVRQGFAALRLALDAALVALDEAVGLLEDGALAEVEELAEEIYWVFRSGQLRREALATLRLFYDAARRREATAALARETARRLKVR